MICVHGLKITNRSEAVKVRKIRRAVGRCFTGGPLWRKERRVQIYILLTENCNLNCLMCIRGKQQGINLDVNKLQRIAGENDFSKDDVVITGGEPALHSDFADIVKLMCGRAKTVTVTTNGTNGDCLEELSDCENLFFQISLDGGRDKHNEIRGGNAFERTWQTLLKLDKLGMQYSVASVVSRKNRNEIFELIGELEKLSGMRYWRVSYEMPFGSAGFDSMMSADEWNCFVDDLLKKVNFRLKIQKIFPFELYEKRKAELEQIPEGRFRSRNCGSGKDKIYIYPDFKVYPCTCLTDFCVGDLSKEPLDRILDSDKNKVFSEYQLAEDSECQSCEYKKFCNGGCIGMSYHYFGKPGMGDIRCPKLQRAK